MQEATMTNQEDSEKKTMTKEVVVEEQQPPLYKTPIAARLDEAVLKGAKSNVNRSSELVPLSQDYDQMRKRLRSVIVAATQYLAAIVQVEKARMEVRILQCMLLARYHVFILNSRFSLNNYQLQTDNRAVLGTLYELSSLRVR
jgi:hypothetical protein